MIPVNPRIATLAPYGLSVPVPPGNFGLDQNESLFPPSPKALAAGQEALARSHIYPDNDWRNLTKAIAGRFALNAANILVGCGSMQLIACLMETLARPGEHVLSTRYAYAYAETTARQFGLDFIRVAEPDFTVDVDRILAAVTPQTRIVFLCNPGNPTGTRIAVAEILRLHDALPADVLLCVDEAYGELSGQSSAPLFKRLSRGNLCILRSFSKAYALAGARVGWGAFPTDLAGEMRKVLSPSNVSVVSQAMALAAFEDQEYLANLVQTTSLLRKNFQRELTTLGLLTPPSHTNFALVQFGDEAKATSALNALRSGGIYPRPMGLYNIPDTLRITIGPEAVMTRCLEILSAEVAK